MCKRVLVTGASGLLGANIVKHLNNKGIIPIAMVRKTSNLLGLQGLSYQKYIGDIGNKHELETIIKTCEYVIHCAANTNQYPNKLENYYHTNVNSTEYISDLCIKYKIKNLIFISSTNCFTNGSKEKGGDENTKFMPWLKKSGYAYSKYLAQKLILNKVKNDGLNAFILAPSFMVGERDSLPSSGQLLLHVLNSKIVFYPQGGKSFVDVNFVADVIIKNLDYTEKGDVFILSGQNLSIKEYVKHVLKISNQRKILIQIPRWMILFLGSVLGLAEKMFNINLQLNKVNAKLLSLDNYFSNKKAVKLLNMKNTNIIKSIDNSIAWFKKNNYIK